MKTRGFEPPARSPIEALSLVLGSVDALRNLRALYLLLFTFALAGLFTAMAQASFVRGGLWAPLEVAAALFVAFYGGNAAGILVMDEARGLAVRDVGEAVRTSLLTAHRLLLAMLLIAFSYALLGAALLALMWLCRPAVSGPLLSPWLFGLAVPLGVVCVGVALLAWIAVVVPLAAPAVWAGAGVMTVVRQLWQWMRHRLLTVALLMAAVSLLTAGVGALVSFVVAAGGRVVSEVGVRLVGIDVPAPELMRGLFGLGARTAGANGHVAAALVGGGIVFAIALVLPGLVYLRGTCSVYLALCEDPR
ncbi:MAG TPA: hypothetical protein VF169_03820 [Albitalea sp.]|uniref:hypothetical protein n=1 Tax=Piscinibacter sp. TaxID=1903157 RepID=UPI002ED1BED3